MVEFWLNLPAVLCLLFGQRFEGGITLSALLSSYNYPSHPLVAEVGTDFLSRPGGLHHIWAIFCLLTTTK